MQGVVRTVLLVALTASALGLSGCRYGVNRYYDFRDTFKLGAGITTENPVTGIVPPSFGLYVEASDFLHLGYITHNGYSAELDLRGTFAGPEYRERAGFLWWQRLQISQDIDAGSSNRFKDPNFAWTQRMESWGHLWRGHPSKRLNYDYFADYPQQGALLMHRGWQYWEYLGVEAAISDPFFTHFGFMLRLGIDISEISDFLLGICTIDFKHDDMTLDEFLDRHGDAYETEPVADRDAPDEGA